MKDIARYLFGIIKGDGSYNSVRCTVPFTRIEPLRYAALSALGTRQKEALKRKIGLTAASIHAVAIEKHPHNPQFS